MPEKLTHEQVNELENKLREAEGNLEAAGRILCPIPGPVAPQLWNQINQLVEGIGDIIHQCYKLRPSIEVVDD